jgi:hypothetical protein
MTLRKNKVEALTPDEMDANFEELETKSNMMLGVGQTWQEVTANRNIGVTYTNTTNKPIQVIYTTPHNANNEAINIELDGIAIRLSSSYSKSGLSRLSGTFTIPINGTYKITSNNSGYWYELR